MKKPRELKLSDIEDIIYEHLAGKGPWPETIRKCAEAILAHEKRVRRRRYADVRRAQY